MKITNMSSQPKLLLLTFFIYKNCKTTFISYKTLQELTGIKSTTTITKWLKYLEWLQFIKIRRCKRSNNTILNIYSIKHARIRDLTRYLKEVNITFKEVEDFWNKNAKTPKSANKLLNNKQSFTETIKNILETR